MYIRRQGQCTKNQIFLLKVSPINVTKSTGKRRIWSHLLTKSLMENFIFYAVGRSLVRLMYDHFRSYVQGTKLKCHHRFCFSCPD